MKVALLAFDETRFGFLKGIYEQLNRDPEFKVRTFTNHHDLDYPDHTRLNWASFNLKKLWEWKPDKIVMFNGYATETLPVVRHIRDVMAKEGETGYKVFHVEQGWLPQRGNIYIDDLGVGGGSHIAMMSKHNEKHQRKIADEFEFGKTIGELQRHYEKKTNPAIAHKKYVVVPLQLEHDTSIIYDSHFFKTMNSFVNFVWEAYKHTDTGVVVKTHPYDKDKKFSFQDNVEVVREGSLNDLIADEKCKGVIGINSTSLMESLIHEKPIACFGRNMISDTGVFVETGNVPNPSKLVHQMNCHKVDKEKIYRVLYRLKQMQFPRARPHKWVKDWIRTGIFNNEWID